MFRFTIRDLLWLTVVVALAVAWWVDRVSLNLELRNLQLENSVSLPAHLLTK